jgi:hypothetical protein
MWRVMPLSAVPARYSSSFVTCNELGVRSHELDVGSRSRGEILDSRDSGVEILLKVRGEEWFV